jgi:DNA invertase Pin-like site-specific DNA recombinase
VTALAASSTNITWWHRFSAPTTREGLDAARARGRTGGRKPKLNARQAATVRRMYEATGPDGKRQHTVAEIAEAVGVHRTTVYDYLRKES